MAHPVKKPWKAPEVRRFETPDDVLALYKNAFPAELEKLEKLLEEMRRERRRMSAEAKPRKNAHG